MTEKLNQPSQDGEMEKPGEREDIASELWRIWISEIKPKFRAEEEFLRKYGQRLGYPKEYIDQISRDHLIMGELVLDGGEENIRAFSKILANYIRYKQESLRSRLEKALDNDEFNPKPHFGHDSKLQPCMG